LAGAVGIGLAGQTPPAQEPPGQTTPSAQKPKVKPVGVTPIVSIDGKDNYEAYCAVCHGRDAKGNGPAAPAMKAAVPDLTTIAARSKGTFDSPHVEYVIRQPGKTPTPAHGAEEMPIWGDVFQTEDRARSTLRIKNLVRYLQSIQTRE
jgi:mono/diheme cytochrome c family protein